MSIKVSPSQKQLLQHLSVAPWPIEPWMQTSTIASLSRLGAIKINSFGVLTLTPFGDLLLKQAVALSKGPSYLNTLHDVSLSRKEWKKQGKRRARGRKIA